MPCRNWPKNAIWEWQDVYKRQVPIIDQEILEVAPQEYKVGINLLADPVGVPSDHIAVSYTHLGRKPFGHSTGEIFEYALQMSFLFSAFEISHL